MLSDPLRSIFQTPERGLSASIRVTMPPLTHRPADGRYCVKVCRDDQPSEEYFFSTGRGAASYAATLKLAEKEADVSIWRLVGSEWRQVS